MVWLATKGVGRKISRGVGGNRKETENNTIKPLPGGCNKKKDRKIAKK